MEQRAANRLIEENLAAIFGFALSRLGDRNAAEALTSDIVYAVLQSAGQLRDDERRYGWLWSIARQCLAAHFRGERYVVGELDEAISDGERSPEEALILREDLARLRRELALLSTAQRRATVLYYIDRLSCGEIASELQISVEMVKQHLFRARKQIREGIQMERIYGEKSYRPEAFEIDFYGTRGGEDSEYRAFAERRLRGNILLATYYSPMRLPELSLELGVAGPYLEDELRLLMKRKYLVERQGKYVTNIPIFTAACTAEITQAIAGVAKDAADGFAALDPREFSAAFGARMADENHLRWQILLMAAHFTLEAGTNGEMILPENEVYAMVNGGGGRGYVWGRSADRDGELSHDIEGIYNGSPSQDRRGSMIAMNFVQNLNVQHVEGGMTDPLVAAVFGGAGRLDPELRKRLNELAYLHSDAPNFAVYTLQEYHQMRTMLAPLINRMHALHTAVAETAARICAEHAPSHIRAIVAETGTLVYRFGGLAQLVDALIEQGYLAPVVEASTAKPTLCIIKNQ